MHTLAHTHAHARTAPSMQLIQCRSPQLDVTTLFKNGFFCFHLHSQFHFAAPALPDLGLQPATVRLRVLRLASLS